MVEGEIIISYRGIDNYSVTDSVSDVHNGWPLAIGNLNAPLAALATELLASVTTEKNKGQMRSPASGMRC